MQNVRPEIYKRFIHFFPRSLQWNHSPAKAGPSLKGDGPVFECIQRIDAILMLWIQNDVRCAVLNPIMIFFTTIGNVGAVWLALGALFLCFKKYRRLGFHIIISIALCYVLNDLIIKQLVQRPRPFLTVEGLTALVAKPSSWSFPSGHACSSFAAAYVLTKALKKKGAWSYALATLIAISRPYVGVHYVSDILAGAIVGTLGAILCIALFRKFEKKPASPPPKV